EGEFGDVSMLLKVFGEQLIDTVMHFAADTGTTESLSDPNKYYQNDFSNTLNLLNAMRKAGVMKIVFSSAAAVYGIPDRFPVDENQMLRPIHPYGRSKMMSEMAIEDFSKAYGLGYVILRYFNVAGAHPDGQLGEDHQPETHLIPRILTASVLEEEKIKIFG